MGRQGVMISMGLLNWKISAVEAPEAAVKNEQVHRNLDKYEPFLQEQIE